MRIRHPLFVASILSLMMLALFSFFHRYNTFPDPDAFYHTKMAMLAREGIFPATFPWLPYTTLAHAFADQQLLYHFFLVPFVTILSPLLGMQYANTLLVTATLLAFFFFIRSFAPSIALFATVTFFAAPSFLLRLLFGKAQPLALVFLFLLLTAVLQEYVFLTFFLSLLFSLTHGSWPFLLFVAFVLFVLGKRRISLAMSAGALSGLAFHPAFPHTIQFFIDQTIRIALLGRYFVGGGQEWYPPTLADLVLGAPLAALFLPLTLVFFLSTLYSHRFSFRSLFLFVCTIPFIFLTFSSRRHIEFALPLLTATFVSVLTDMGGMSVLTTFFSRRWRNAAVVMLALSFGVMVVQSARRIDTVFAEAHPSYYLFGVAQFIDRELSSETIVLSDWSVFPQLFFATRNTRFLMGLDPRFLFFKDPVRYAAWEALRTDDTISVSTILRDRLSIPFLLILREETALLSRALRDEALLPIYTDEEATLFRLRS